MTAPESGPPLARPSWRRAPLVGVLLAQAAGAAIAFGAALIGATWLGIAAPLFAVLTLQGIVAARIGERLLRLPRWWIPIQMTMPPAAALVSMLAVPAWVHLAIFASLAVVFWNSARSRVPLYLTNRTTELALAALLPPRPGARFVDLGHGFGATVLALARIRPDMSVEGIESAPIPFIVSYFRRLFGGPSNARLMYGDFWNRSLAGYDMVYAFLSPEPMSALYDKARREMPPGGILVSNSFAVENVAADEVRILDDGRRTHLHLYRM